MRTDEVIGYTRFIVAPNIASSQSSGRKQLCKNTQDDSLPTILAFPNYPEDGLGHYADVLKNSIS